MRWLAVDPPVETQITGGDRGGHGGRGVGGGIDVPTDGNTPPAGGKDAACAMDPPMDTGGCPVETLDAMEWAAPLRWRLVGFAVAGAGEGCGGCCR